MSLLPSDPADWDLPTLAHVWDAKTRAIIAGADRLESLTDTDRAHCLTALSQRVRVLTRDLDDSWWVATAFSMVEDLYRSCFRQFHWSPGMAGYLAATAGVFLQELAQRGFVLHYVIDNTQTEADLVGWLAALPPVFQTAGMMVTGPQLMALELMQRDGHHDADVSVLQRYREEGHWRADQFIARCHRERRSSVYLNLDLDDDTPALPMDVALSPTNQPGTIMVFRNQPPVIGSLANIATPPGGDPSDGSPARTLVVTRVGSINAASRARPIAWRCWTPDASGQAGAGPPCASINPSRSPTICC